MRGSSQIVDVPANRGGNSDFWPLIRIGWIKEMIMQCPISKVRHPDPGNRDSYMDSSVKLNRLQDLHDVRHW